MSAISINTLKTSENRTVSSTFRLDGHKFGRDQVFRLFPKSLEDVFQKIFQKFWKIAGTVPDKLFFIQLYF